MSVQVRQYAFLLFWAAFSFGLTLSPALISIGQAGLALIGILSLKSFTISKEEKYLSILFMAFYLSSAISCLYSDDSSEAIRKLILKLPLILFPFFIFSFKTIKNQAFWIICIFSYSIFFPAAVSVYNYFLNKQLFDILILESKPLPIEFGYGIYHIQFSILLALSILIGIDYLINHYANKNIQWYTLLFLTGFNFAFIHILSARTGLLSLYVGVALYMILKFNRLGKKWMLLGLTSALAMLVLMITISSSLQNRIKNTAQDLKVVWEGKDPNDYSFALRVQAWKNATKLIAKHPFGVGIGDAEKKLFEQFATTNPQVMPENRKNPHFQLLELGAQSGLLSMLLFLSIFIYGCVSIKKQNLLKSILLLLFTASCFESILERQASVAAFAVFTAMAFVFIFQKSDSQNRTSIEF